MFFQDGLIYSAIKWYFMYFGFWGLCLDLFGVLMLWLLVRALFLELFTETSRAFWEESVPYRSHK